jgi:hypothetical protein
VAYTTPTTSGPRSSVITLYTGGLATPPGIYHGLFDSLKAALLGESLEGASLKGFDTEQEALDFWFSHTSEDGTVTEI